METTQEETRQKQREAYKRYYEKNREKIIEHQKNLRESGYYRTKYSGDNSIYQRTSRRKREEMVNQAYIDARNDEREVLKVQRDDITRHLEKINEHMEAIHSIWTDMNI